VSRLRANIFGSRWSNQVARLPTVLAFLVLAAAIHSARADVPPAAPGVAAQAVATPPASAAASPAPAGPAAPAVPPGRFDDDQVRRGPATTSPAAQTAAGNLSSGYDLPRVGGALAVVIALIFLLRWLGRRLFALPTAQRSSRVVQVLSRSVLTPKQQLVLVRVGQRVLVTADNGSQLSPLSEITDPDEVASLIGQLQSEKDGGVFGTAKAFNSMFGRVKKSYGGRSDEAHEHEDPVDDEEDPDHPSEEHADLEGPGYAVSLSTGAGPASTDNVVAATRQELNGLMEKVRLVSDQFGRT